MLSDQVLEAARLASAQINGQFSPLWGSSGAGEEVTFPRFAASPATLSGQGTYFHLIRSSSAGLFRGATCLYGNGETGASFVVSLYIETSPGTFRLRTLTGEMASIAGSAIGDVSSDFALPVDVRAGDYLVVGASWSTVGSGAGPVLGQRSGVLPLPEPYRHQAKATASMNQPLTLSFRSMTESASAPWISLYR